MLNERNSERQIYDREKLQESLFIYTFDTISQRFSNRKLSVLLLEKRLIHILRRRLGKEVMLFYASSNFIIQKGQAQVSINQKQVKVILEGDYFADCNFLMLDRGKFRKAVEDIMIKEYDENRKFINEVNFFSFLRLNKRFKKLRFKITIKGKQYFRKIQNVNN
ncbi:unnamed protein product [Paramecium sonneborni]|uniref:Cyclic nucleotide-binding domain-containing protein n=1 Tax=Paramecium sonneborni TaxID=65129 RepID=A0A8S1RQP6_9CILI|nr:unnamed protein product [Paramecium sonneborni]